MSWSTKTRLRERSTEKVSNMEHWNKFVQAVLTGNYKEDGQRKDVRESDWKKTSLAHTVDIKKRGEK